MYQEIGDFESLTLVTPARHFIDDNMPFFGFNQVLQLSVFFLNAFWLKFDVTSYTCFSGFHNGLVESAYLFILG